MEEWRDIKGYEGIYQVSSLGRVRSLDRTIYTKPIIYKDGSVRGADGIFKPVKGRIFKPQLGKNGYLFVMLCINNKHHPKGIHRMVAEAFVPGYKKGYVVNHKDECKTNNRADNLEWVTWSLS